MTSLASPGDEEGRLEALASYNVVGTPPETDYDHIARLAADLFDVPIALVSFVERDTQWFKARIGLEASQTDRNLSFCTHAIKGDNVCVVPDATHDRRFADNPLVTGEPHIRFYAGAPLIEPSGHKLGTLCVIDSKPRPPLRPEQQKLLQSLAGLIMDRLELRRLNGIQQFATQMAATTSDAMLCARGDNTITFWNRGAEALFGYAQEEAVGQPVHIIVPERLRAAHAAGMRRVREGGEPRIVGRPVEIVGRRKDGSEVPIELSLALWREGDELISGAIIRDISERRRTEEQLKHLAHYDPLTGLPNRVLFQERLEAATAGRGTVTQLILDLDRFKDVNDCLGYSEGDQLLIAVAERLRCGLGPQDTLARLGADEFGIVMPGCGDPRLAGVRAEAILAAFSEPFAVNGSTLHIATSVGIAMSPGLCAGDELMASADLALNRAKAEGGGRYEFFQPALRQQATARRSLEGELRRAFEEGEFELHYQPQVRLCDGVIEGAEALIRWRHPERGLLQPGAFLPVLDSSALAAPVGEWTIETGCRFAASLAEAGLPGIRLGVNLFAAQFRAGNLVAIVTRALQQSGLPAADLELEVTENIALRHDEAMTGPLRELRAMGVSLAFDDYGTGYASLSMLKRFPITRLKIDREFIRDLVTDPDDAAIVRAVLALGRSLGFEVIAEGIETHEQAALLAAHGCDEGQGYLYGRPMTGAEFRKLLAASDSRAGGTALRQGNADRR